MDRVILKADDLELGLEPSVGGAFTHFIDHSRGEPVDLLRRASPGFTDALDSAGFALVPFCNRVRDGRFSFDGRQIQLPSNSPGQKHPMHGQGWRSAWTVADLGEASATLAFRHEAGDWPWTYEARLAVALKGRGLDVTLACRNLSPSVMPCGLGLHPYHPCDGQTLLQTGVTSVWTVDDEVMPVASVPAQGRYDLSRRLICGQGLDNGYDGWSGDSLIHWPGQGRGLRLTSPCPRFQLFSPPQGGLFVAEPVTNANAALNRPQAEWPALGLWLLATGEAAVISARYDVLIA
jgi:aldose 1-epimerase